MNQDIELSFIVPIYNVELYLEKCLESILSQEISKEIILINDGSTDNSLNIALEYAYKYDFITLIHSKNEGQSSARNKGIKLAKGKYIYFVDSDDYLSENILPSVLLRVDKNNADIIHLQGMIEYENKPSISTPRVFSQALEADHYVMKAESALFLLLSREWMPGICWTLIKREFLLKHQLYFIENLKAEDQLFYLQLLTSDLEATFLECPEIVYHYKKRVGSTTNSVTIQYVLDHLNIIELIKSWLKEKSLDNNHKLYHLINEKIIGNLYDFAKSLYFLFPSKDQEKYPKLFK